MKFWNGAASIEVYILTVFVLALFVAYIFLKLKYEKIIFSPFNISLFINMFTVVMLPFMYENAAWIKLWETRAQPFYDFLNKNAVINLIGWVVFFLSLIYFEFKKVKNISLLTVSIKENINAKVIQQLFCISCIAWFLIVFTLNGNLPVLNGQRDFYKDFEIINLIYMALIVIIPPITVYFGIIFIRDKSKMSLMFLVTGCVICFGTANRADLITKTLYPLLIFWVYKYGKNFIKKTWKVLFGLILLFVLGLILAYVRGNNTTTLTIIYLFNELIYGNTFSDFRDGAYILSSYEEKFDSFLYGKTYFAGIIAFMPSYLSEYRQTWAWGYFSTTTLFGITGHFGLRGGSFLEPYLNFGYVGVLLFALVFGKWNAYRERRFYDYLHNQSNKGFEKEYLALYIAGILYNALLISNGMLSFYVLIITVVGLSAIKKGRLIVLRKKQH